MLRLYSAGDEEVSKCLMGELNSGFAYKVIPQDDQMDNILERMLIVSNDILMMHLADIES